MLKFIYVYVHVVSCDNRFLCVLLYITCKKLLLNQWRVQQNSKPPSLAYLESHALVT